jgi:GDP-L-fucose synthase
MKYWKEYQENANFITIGSSCMYPPDELPEEDKILDGQPHKSLYSYAMSKRMLLVGLMSAKKQFDMNYLMLVPDTLYGPKFKKNNSHFIFDIIRKLVNYKKNKIPFEFLGSGEEFRGVTYIKDFVDLILENIDFKIFPPDQINVINASCESFYIRDFVRKICKILEINEEEILHFYNSKKSFGPKAKYLISKEKVKTPIDVGLKNTIEYYLKLKEEK